MRAALEHVPQGEAVAIGAQPDDHAFGEIRKIRVMPEGLARLADWPSLTTAMEARAWSEERILRLLGSNWLRFLGDVWARPHDALGAAA